MITDLLATVAPGTPLLAVMVLLHPRVSSRAAAPTALAGAGLSLAALVALLVLAPAAGLPALGGLLYVQWPGLLVALLAAVIAVLVVAFADRALAGDARPARFARLASLLTAATITLALAGHLVVLAAAWIAVGLAVVALLAHRPSAAAHQAVRRTRATFLLGDGALVLAAVLTMGVAGGVSWRGDPGAAVAALAAVPVLSGGVPVLGAVSLVEVVAVLLVVAAMSRSALVPLHRWLPSTLAAPTPVSALLHAGVVNGAGVLLLALAPVLGAAPVATALAFAAGMVTLLMAMGVMLVRADVKGGLAWSTAGQMGFMVVQISIGALGAALFHLLGHGLYKAAAFLGAGDAISAHARSRHRPVPTVHGLTRAHRLAVIAAPTVGLALAWWVLSPGFSPAKTLLFATVAWLLTAHLVSGWLRVLSLGTAAGVRVALVGGPVVAGGYLAAVVGFERVLGASLPTLGSGAVGVVPLAVVLGGVALLGGLVVAVPEDHVLRIRLHAVATGLGVRPLPVPLLAAADPVPVEVAGVTASPPARLPIPFALASEVSR